MRCIWSSSSFVCFPLFSRNCWRRLRNSNLWIGWPVISALQHGMATSSRNRSGEWEADWQQVDWGWLTRGIASTCLPTFCKSSSQDIRVGKGGGSKKGIWNLTTWYVAFAPVPLVDHEEVVVFTPCWWTVLCQGASSNSCYNGVSHTCRSTSCWNTKPEWTPGSLLARHARLSGG